MRAVAIRDANALGILHSMQLEYHSTTLSAIVVVMIQPQPDEVDSLLWAAIWMQVATVLLSSVLPQALLVSLHLSN